jgi:hypothetical protein
MDRTAHFLAQSIHLASFSGARGAHQIGRGIWRAYVTHPELTTAELIRWAYPRGQPNV